MKEQLKFYQNKKKDGGATSFNASKGRGAMNKKYLAPDLASQGRRKGGGGSDNPAFLGAILDISYIKC